jgi:hypothetical protein
MVFLRNLIGGLLAELEDDIDRDKFKRLLHYSRRLAAFQNRAKLVGKTQLMKGLSDQSFSSRFKLRLMKFSNKMKI